MATAAAIGASLAAVALVVKQEAKRAEARHPATGQFVEALGVRLHYLDRGTGAPVVLLHGNGVHARDFVGSGLFDALSQRYRVISVDRPGFGYSERPRRKAWSAPAQAELLQAFFEQLGIERPIVVAHSWATMIALELALNKPDGLRGLLLISGYYYPTRRWDALLKSGPAVPVVGDVMRYTISPLLGRIMTPMEVRLLFSPLPVPPEFDREVPLGLMLRPSQLRAAAAECGMMRSGAKALCRRFGDLRLPVTLAAGDQDRIVNHRAHAVPLHEALPNSQLLVFPGRGHMLHYAEPEKLAGAVDGLVA